MTQKKKLALLDDITKDLANEGVMLTPNAVRAKLRNAMRHLAKESCHAMGTEVSEDELEHIAGSRAFQEAVASLLIEEDSH